MAYTPGMIVADAVAANLAKASWIRRMFEEGARLKQERGADKVFDFTLGNPEIEPPPAVLAAARRCWTAASSTCTPTCPTPATRASGRRWPGGCAPPRGWRTRPATSS
jgi:aspartate/methionine/tyrosine aminotransferase